VDFPKKVRNIYRFIRKHRKDIKKLSDMIEKIKEGKELPKLEEL
jgi:hypothetical protein